MGLFGFDKDFHQTCNFICSLGLTFALFIFCLFGGVFVVFSLTNFWCSWEREMTVLVFFW